MSANNDQPKKRRRAGGSSNQANSQSYQVGNPLMSGMYPMIDVVDELNSVGVARLYRIMVPVAGLSHDMLQHAARRVVLSQLPDAYLHHALSPISLMDSVTGSASVQSQEATSNASVTSVTSGSDKLTADDGKPAKL